MSAWGWDTPTFAFPPAYHCPRGAGGRPFAVAGARLFMKSGYKKGEEYSREEPSPFATTAPDGRFRFTAPKAPSGAPEAVVTAMAADYGAGWVAVPAGESEPPGRGEAGVHG